MAGSSSGERLSGREELGERGAVSEERAAVRERDRLCSACMYCSLTTIVCSRETREWGSAKDVGDLENASAQSQRGDMSGMKEEQSGC